MMILGGATDPPADCVGMGSVGGDEHSMYTSHLQTPLSAAITQKASLPEPSHQRSVYPLSPLQPDTPSDPVPNEPTKGERKAVWCEK